MKRGHAQAKNLEMKEPVQCVGPRRSRHTESGCRKGYGTHRSLPLPAMDFPIIEQTGRLSLQPEMIRPVLKAEDRRRPKSSLRLFRGDLRLLSGLRLGQAHFLLLMISYHRDRCHDRPGNEVRSAQKERDDKRRSQLSAPE